MSEDNVAVETKNKWSFELWMRKTFKWVIDPVAGFLLKLGLTPNMVTLLGFLISLVSAIFVGVGKFSVAGLILLCGAPLDVIDGSMARKLGEPSKYGSFIDSVIDRYSELAIFGGFLFYFSMKGDWKSSLLTFFAAAGSLLVSYVKARAEGLGLTAKVGLLTRVERVIILILGLLLGYPIIALWIIAILANFTAIQRIIHVRKQTLTKN